MKLEAAKIIPAGICNFYFKVVRKQLRAFPPVGEVNSSHRLSGWCEQVGVMKGAVVQIDPLGCA
jgi:hypothetical protein